MLGFDDEAQLVLGTADHGDQGLVAPLQVVGFHAGGLDGHAQFVDNAGEAHGNVGNGGFHLLLARFDVTTPDRSHFNAKSLLFGDECVHRVKQCGLLGQQETSNDGTGYHQQCSHHDGFNMKVSGDQGGNGTHGRQRQRVDQGGLGGAQGAHGWVLASTEFAGGVASRSLLMLSIKGTRSTTKSPLPT